MSNTQTLTSLKTLSNIRLASILTVVEPRGSQNSTFPARALKDLGSELGNLDSENATHNHGNNVV